MPPPPPLRRRDPRAAAAKRRLGPAAGAKRPPGPASPSPSRRGGGDTRTRPSRRPGPVRLFLGYGGGREGGGVSPHIPLPPAPPLWGNFPTKKARGRGAFLGWKFPADPLLENKRIFCGPETSGRGINASPSHFSKRNHPQMKAKHCGYFCGFVYFVFNESGRGRHRDNFFFYEGENLIFPDFVAGGGGAAVLAFLLIRGGERSGLTPPAARPRSSRHLGRERCR